MLAQPARLLAVSGLLVACSGNQEPDTSGPMPQTSNIDTNEFGGKDDDYSPHIAVLSTGEPVVAAATTGTFAKAVNGDPDATLLCIPP